MISLRTYQAKAVDSLTKPLRNRAFVVAPAGSGKTIIFASAASIAAKTFDKIGVLVNTKEQCEQAREALGRCAWPDGVEFVVRCVAAQPDVSDCDILILDEAHHLPAATWFATAAKAPRIVWGFSATPWHRDEERNDCLRGFFGEGNFFTVAREEVRAGGHLAEGRVVFHDLDTPGEFDADIKGKTAATVAAQCLRFRNADKDELTRRARWRFTAEAVRGNCARNCRILSLANDGDAVLVLVGTIEHGEHLAAEIDGAVLVHAKLGKKKRAAAIDGFRSGEIRCMIATSLADEGLDVPRASVLILASGGRSAGKIEQRAGRVLRPFEGKAFGLVHDFSDRGSVMGAAQARAREKTYRSLGYAVRTISNPQSQAA